MTGLYDRSAIIDYTTCNDWTNIYSTNNIECPKDYLMIGIECKDNDCSAIKIKCCRARGTFYGSVTSQIKGCKKELIIYIQENHEYTDFVSYTDIGKEFRQKININHRFATGIECKTFNSPRLSITCDQFRIRGQRLQCGDENYLIEDEWRDKSCEWLEFTSFNSLKLECPKNKAITGINCKGIHCKHLSIQCCNFGHVCPKGYYGNNIECKACPLGTFGSDMAISSRMCSGQCAKGYYGTEKGQTSSKCNNACPKGTYKATEGGENINSCKLCPPGYYGDSFALTTKYCTSPCPLGTYRSKSGAKSIKDCLDCPYEHYNSNLGATSCKRCPIGKYLNEVGSTTKSDCKTCPPSYRGYQCVGGFKAEGDL